MNPTEIEAQVSLLHSCFQKMTGQSLPLRSICDERRLGWEHFVAAGHSVKQLETVILHLKREIQAERRRPGCLRWSNLILDLNHFDEEFAEATACTRNLKPAPSPKAVVAQQFSPVVAQNPVKDNVRSVTELIEAMRIAANSPALSDGA